MDTIVTPVTVITLDSTRIVHSIKADLVARYFPPVVRLVQYDQSLPVIAVSLMQNGQTYTLPSGAAANIRVHKPDATYVYNPALGCDSTRNIVYFEVTQAMAAANGDGLAIVEIVVDGDIAGTSLITLHFEENPVPEDAIESSDEWETIYELGERIIASTVTPVSTAAGMTDHNVVYLYTGTESGWNQGHMYYYNGTTWVDVGIAVTDTTLSVAGLAADAKKTGDEIEGLKDGFNDIFYSPSDAISLPWVDGYYLNVSNGNPGPSSAYSISRKSVSSSRGNLPEVKPSTLYTVKHVGNLQYGFYDSSYGFIANSAGNITASDDVTEHTIQITSPSNAQYVVFSCKTINKNRLMLCEGDYYEKYTINAETTAIPPDSITGSANNPRIITVGTDKQFTSLRKALDSITDSNEYNRYLVLFYGDGSVYDVKTDFTTAELNAADTSTIGIRVPPFTTLFGVGGKEKCILNAEFSSQVREFSTLNLYSSSSLIGFTVKCTNARYAVHDDWYNNVVESDFNVDRIIADCDIIATTPRYYMPYGAGIRSGRKWTYKNVLFKNNTSGLRAYSVHNNVNFTTPARIVFENCRFEGYLLDSLIALQTLTDSIVNTALFKGCKMSNGGKISCFESSGNTGCSWMVTGYANTFGNADVTITTSDGIDYSNRIDLI